MNLQSTGSFCGNHQCQWLNRNRSYDFHYGGGGVGVREELSIVTRVILVFHKLDNSNKFLGPHNYSLQILVSAVYIFRFHNGAYLAIYTCLFRWCYGHFYNRLTQFIVYCSYVVCTILLRRPVDLSTHWTVTAISLHVTTFVGVCHE